ncbi:hypothetical protein ACHAW6_009652 [Cyclotella cf. meneghiniana]
MTTTRTISNVAEADATDNLPNKEEFPAVVETAPAQDVITLTETVDLPPQEESTNEEAIPEVKFVLIGTGGVGKTTFAKRDIGQSKPYVASIGLTIYSYLVQTTCGRIRINLWDTPGQEAVGRLRDAYYTDASGAIIMFDVSSRITYKEVPNWHRDFTRVNENKNVPVALVGNKIDLPNRARVHYHERQDNMAYFAISCLENNNVDEPLLWGTGNG